LLCVVDFVQPVGAAVCWNIIAVPAAKAAAAAVVWVVASGNVIPVLVSVVAIYTS
jgi:hypothetical protein